MKKLCLLPALALAPFMSFAQREATITLKTNEATQQISKHIYGHFAEHLGTCVYGGLWVGGDSKIPHTNGYRNAVKSEEHTSEPQSPSKNSYSVFCSNNKKQQT